MGKTILAQNTHEGAAPFQENYSPDCFSKTFTRPAINPEGEIVDSTFTPVLTSERSNLVGIVNDNCNLADVIFGDTRFDLVGSNEQPLDPLLTPLADFGGPTLTHSPFSPSPAIDGAVFGTSATFFDCPANRPARPKPAGRRGFFRNE